MRVFDPLYGSFLVDRELSELALTPEVRRLSQIRLLNTVSPSLAVLGDLRRYSHTLGVLHLASLSPCSAFSKSEKRALLAAVLLHDISTPAFGHLVEYLLQEQTRGEWHHERRIVPTVRGTGQPENVAHQIFGGRTISFRRRIQELDFDTELVEEIAGGRHPLSTLLFGSLDLDNLDNVTRMCWALGLSNSSSVATRLASSIEITEGGALVLDEEHDTDVRAWLELRRRAYEVVVFDGPTVALQAVLTAAVERALASGFLTSDDWDLFDEELLARLGSAPETKELLSLDYFGQPPGQLFSIQVELGRLEPDISRVRCRVREVAQDFGIGGRFYPHVFLDRRAFSKHMSFQGRSGVWSVGEDSESAVIYGFSSCAPRVTRHQRRKLVEEVLAGLEIEPIEAVVFLGEEEVQDGSQPRIPFPA